MANIGPVLFEILGNILDKVVIADLVVGRKLTQVDQLGE